MFKLAYCDSSVQADYTHYKSICKHFVDLVGQYYPNFMKKPKFHLLLHLADNIVDFGPPSTFNTERCKLLNLIGCVVQSCFNAGVKASTPC